MLLLKANPELKKTFERLIQTMKLPVTWTELFMIANNHLILAGEVRSLVFDFDAKKVSTSILEVPIQGSALDPMPADAMLNNVLNMTLYAFGKWGAVSGLRVTQDYSALNTLFGNVLRPVKTEPDFSTETFRFYKEGMQITYEDMMLSVLRLLKSEGRLKEGQSLSTSDTEEADETPLTATDTDTTIPDDDDYEIGLWHSMRWKKKTYDIQKASGDSQNASRSRIGNDFYLTGYLCPDCGEPLYMGVYPADRELLIETDEGRVYMARTYACHHCNTFYTPQPQKLFQEGDLYTLSFDKDRTAYEDYLAVLGRKTAKTKNYHFNEFESERSKRQQEEAAKDAANADVRHETGIANSAAYSASQRDVPGKNTASDARQTPENKTHFQNTQSPGTAGTISGNGTAAVQETAAPAQRSTASSQGAAASTQRGTASSLEAAASTQRGTASSQETAASAQRNMTSSQEAVASIQKSTVSSLETTASAQKPAVSSPENPAQLQGAAASPEPETAPPSPATRQEMARLAGKTTDELKSILTNLERASQSAQTPSADARDKQQYMESVRATLRSKLSAKYNARMGTLQNLSPRQLSDLKKQIEKEAVLSEEQKQEYLDKIDERLYHAEKNALAQKIELGKKKSYTEVQQMMIDIEKQDIPQTLKQDALDKLQQIKNARAEQEVAHLISHLPLHLDRKQLAAYLSKIDQYEGVDISPYRAQLEQRKDMAEKEEISAMVKRGGKKDRDALWKLYNQLQEQDYKEENKAPFLEKIHEKIRQLDEAKIDEICPSIASLSFADGMRIYEEISQGMFLPELKTNTLEMIKRRLTRLKTDESVQLMRKLKEDMEEKMEDLSHFHFYDARDELKRAQTPGYDTRPSDADTEGYTGEDADKGKQRSAMLYAINGYASAREPYEYPLAVYDNSRSGNGKEGFVLTPDHIFYHTLLHTGKIDITDIEQVRMGKNIFEKGIYLQRSGFGKEKLPQKLKKSDQAAFTDILEEFVKYLQERPESRSIEYMAKETHDIIRCYRCGFAYKGGGACPRCGSAQNR
ncbi:MAG: hypothetical protein NC318_07495 [Blautia sp.]|nr:hypothetical protein [Lachnoclostridium sp.]MCM1211432.1 hypothetical protein [Blautia sp.]